MSKRVYLPVDKQKIQEAIDAYMEYDKHAAFFSMEDTNLCWNKFSDTFNEICPGSHVWATRLFQAMKWSGTLTVDRVYYTIIASGTNTVLVEEDEL